MDPPSRPSLRRSASTRIIKSESNDFNRDASPSPFALKARKMSLDTRRNGSVALEDNNGLEWDETNSMVSRRTTRLQVELAECVETKTVTTTTTTKRSYPPLLVQPPRSLHTLDAKEYPLALKPTPHELTNFSYEIDGEIVHFCEDNPSSSTVCNCLPDIRLL
jgi:F-box and WD-40 domain protein CDC4